jgi:uncharacterized protein YbjT (DUF2867 family)
MSNERKETTEKTILVLGANGKTGSRVLQRLQERGIPTRAGSRSATPKFDWEDKATWKPALQNIHAVYIAFHPDLAAPGTFEVIRSFTERAVQNGVQQLVLLSGRNEEEAQACEQVVINSGVKEWTIVRASWFSQNFSEGYLLDSVLAGHVVLPAGNVGEPFIDVDDIADVAVAALTEKGHSGKVYEVTGPRLLTFKEAVQEISKALGRPVQYQQVPLDAFITALPEQGVPKEFVELLAYLFGEVLDGRSAHVADGVQRALGRKATDFSDYLKKAIASGAWNKQP